MKRVTHLLAIALLTLPCGLYAQATSPIDTGSWIVGGSASISHEQGDVEPTTSLGVSPQGLRFVAPRVAVGGVISLGATYTASGYTIGYGIGPAIQYYFAEPASRTLPFIGASVIPSWERIHLDATGTSSSYSATSSALRYEATAGITQLVADHVGLTGTGYLSHLSESFTSQPTTLSETTYGIRFGVTAFVF